MNKKTFFKTLLIVCLMALPLNVMADDYPRGDCNQDGIVNITDVSTLITYVLNNVWPGGTDSNYQIYTVNGVSFKMIKVEGGSFMMGAIDGDNDAYNDEKPAHNVILSDFRIAETEVTQALWEAVMGTNPSPYTDDPNCPVENVSWIDAHTFIAKLNMLTGKSFRLPTEAEWEYAARGGIHSQGYLYAGGNNMNEVGWYWDNCSVNGVRRTHPVGTLAPNELGLYDMSGNVWEICQDRYASDYYSNSPVYNPTGPSTGTNINDRGGSWYNDATKCRVTYRDHDSFSGSAHAGLRLAM